MSEFDKQFIFRRNLIDLDINKEQFNNEEKGNTQFELYLNKRNKPKFCINVNELKKENNNKVNLPILEIYVGINYKNKNIKINNTEKEGIKIESRKNSKQLFKKIDINSIKEKNKEEIKEEKNKIFSEIIKKPQDKNITNKRNVNNEALKSINNTTNDKTETTYENSQNNENNKNEIKLNATQIKKPLFHIPLKKIREKIIQEKGVININDI